MAADEDAGDAGEDGEAVGFTFVASVESSAADESGQDVLNGPAVAALPLRGFDPFAGDAVDEAASTQPSPQVGRTGP
ncbi:hypothetical protein [Streptomyces filamentosus]|uniref:hypothetical protein n=1 Tax=Streptomyces filamentosus TaxID=67294 RepID=UPI0037CDFA39